jgi:hypothetical protein
MTLRPRSLLNAAAGVALAVLIAATAALAAPPTREPLELEDFVAENVCSFPVLIEATANKEFVTFFDDGRTLVTGKLFVRLTSVETGTSLEVNVSGPVTVTETEVIRGRGLLILFPEDAGGPGLLLTTGRVVLVRGDDGFIANATSRGRTVDVCAALAA